MLIQSFLFSIQGLAAKALTNVSAFTLAYFRGMGMYIFQIYILNRYQLDPYLLKDDQLHKDMILRGFIGFLAITGLFFAVKLISLMEAMTLSNLTPVMTGLSASIFLKEPFKKNEIISSIICFIGLLLIVKPPFMNSLLGLQDSQIDEGGEGTHLLGALLSLNFSISMTFVFLVIRKTRNSIHTIIPNQYFALSNFLFAPLGMIFEEYQFPTLFEISVLIYLMLSTSFNFALRTRALQLEKAGKVSICNNASIFFSYIFDVVIFKQTMSSFSVVGALFIALGSSILFFKS